MRILGIDPGTATTGFGIIDFCKNQYQLCDFGHISTPKTLPLAQTDPNYSGFKNNLSKMGTGGMRGGGNFF